MNTTTTSAAAATSDWAPDLAELAERRTIARQLGGEESVARHRAQGKLTARERLDGLLDDGSFNEIGMLAGGVKYGADRKRESFTPSNAVVGVGKIDARRTVVASDDYTIRAGSSEGSVSEKWIFADRYAWNTSCRSCAWSTAPAAASSCSTRWGTPRSPAIRCCR